MSKSKELLFLFKLEFGLSMSPTHEQEPLAQLGCFLFVCFFLILEVRVLVKGDGCAGLRDIRGFYLQ